MWMWIGWMRKLSSRQKVPWRFRSRWIRLLFPTKPKCGKRFDRLQSLSIHRKEKQKRLGRRPGFKIWKVEMWSSAALSQQTRRYCSSKEEKERDFKFFPRERDCPKSLLCIFREARGCVQACGSEDNFRSRWRTLLNWQWQQFEGFYLKSRDSFSQRKNRRIQLHEARKLSVFYVFTDRFLCIGL